jgi:hypothetical protein
VEVGAQLFGRVERWARVAVALAASLTVCAAAGAGSLVTSENPPPGGVWSQYATTNDNSQFGQTFTVQRGGLLESVDLWLGAAMGAASFQLWSISDPADLSLTREVTLASDSLYYDFGDVGVPPFLQPGGFFPDTGALWTIHLAPFGIRVTPGEVLALTLFDDNNLRVYGAFGNPYPDGSAWFACLYQDCPDPANPTGPPIVACVSGGSCDFARIGNDFDAFFRFNVPEPSQWFLTLVAGVTLTLFTSRGRCRSG